MWFIQISETILFQTKYKLQSLGHSGYRRTQFHPSILSSYLEGLNLWFCHENFIVLEFERGTSGRYSAWNSIKDGVRCTMRYTCCQLCLWWMLLTLFRSDVAGQRFSSMFLPTTVDWSSSRGPMERRPTASSLPR